MGIDNNAQTLNNKLDLCVQQANPMRRLPKCMYPKASPTTCQQWVSIKTQNSNKSRIYISSKLIQCAACQ